MPLDVKSKLNYRSEGVVYELKAIYAKPKNVFWCMLSIGSI